VARENQQKIDQWGATDTVIVTRKPMKASMIPGIISQAGFAGLTPVYWPGTPFPNAFTQFLRTPDVQQFYKSYPFDITPVGDNRPFFFYTVQPRDIIDFLGTAYKGSADYKINKAVPLLFGLMGVSLLATIVTLALPPLLLGARLPSEKGVRRFHSQL
jgi:hypothetical protein